MTRHYLLCISVLLFGVTQAQRYEWVTLPDAPLMIQTSVPLVVDGAGFSYLAYSYLSPGSVGGQALVTWPGAGSYDIAVTKFDQLGSPVWTTTFGGQFADEVRDIAVDESGAVYLSIQVIGTLPIFSEDSTFATTSSYNVMKLSASGSCARLAAFPAPVRLDALRYEIYLSSNNAIYRMDTTLATVWSYTATGSPLFNGGGLGVGTVSARGDRVAFTGFDSGGPVNIGGLIDPGNGSVNDQAVVVVFDTAGTGQWVYQTDGTNSAIEFPRDVALDDAGNVFVGLGSNSPTFQFAGITQMNGNGNPNLHVLAKLSATGAEEWAVRFEAAAGAGLFAIAVNGAGEVAFAGSHTNGGTMSGLSIPNDFGLYVAKVANDGTPIWLKDDFGYAYNGGGWGLDDGPNNEFWISLTDYGPLDMDCMTTPAFGSMSDFVVARISDLQQVLPIAAFTFGSSGLDVQFTNGSTNATSWIWDLGDGSVSTDQDPSHSYGSSGTYTVVLTVVSGPCSDSDTGTVTVVATGIVDHGTARSLVYPNPTSGLLTLDAPAVVRSVRIFNATGQLIVDRWIGDPRTTIDLSTIAPGAYQVHLETLEGTLITTVVIQPDH